MAATLLPAGTPLAETTRTNAPAAPASAAACCDDFPAFSPAQLPQPRTMSRTPPPPPVAAAAPAPSDDAVAPRAARTLFTQPETPQRPSSRNSDSSEDAGDAEDAAEDEAARLERELAESEALAMQLMQEESLEAYRQAQMAFEMEQGEEGFAELLRQLGGDDLAREEGGLPDDDELAAAEEAAGEDGDGEAVDPDQMTYEELLELGDAIGDVAEERWQLRAAAEIARLPLHAHDAAGGFAYEDRCVVCQCAYEQAEQLRTLPCRHVFHQECVDTWLGRKSTCPFCKQSIC